MSGGVLQPGATGNGTTDDSAAIRYWLTTTKGGILRVPRGKYRVGSECPFVNNGTILFGEGFGGGGTAPATDGGSTFLLDNGFDAFTFHSLRNCGIINCRIDAASARSSGYAVRIYGGSSEAGEALPNFTNLAKGGHFFDVDLNNQFNGFGFEDEGGRGDWCTTIGHSARKANWQNFGAGGKGVFFNTPAGGSQVVRNVFMSTLQATGMGRAIHYRGSADILLDHVVHLGAGGGFLCDPGTTNPSIANGALVTMVACQWDSVASAGGPYDNVKFDMRAGMPGYIHCDMVGTWVAGATGHGLYVTGDGGSGSKLQLSWKGGCSRLNTGYGVRVDNGAGTSNIAIDSQLFLIGNTAGTSLFT